MTLKGNTVLFAGLTIRKTGRTPLLWDEEPQQAAASESRRQSADDIKAFLHRRMDTQGRILRKPLPSERMISSHSKALSSSSASEAQLPRISNGKAALTMTMINRKPLLSKKRR